MKRTTTIRIFLLLAVLALVIVAASQPSVRNPVVGYVRALLSGNPQVLGPSITGHGIYVVDDYTIYPDESQSSHTFWRFNLNNTFIWTDFEGFLHVTSNGEMGLSLETETLEDTTFGFKAWGPYNTADDANKGIAELVKIYQEIYPKAAVTGYTCEDAYFNAGSPLSNKGWCN